MAPFLSDHVGIKLILDFPGSRDIREERFGNTPPAPFLVENRLAELNAFATDVDIAGTFDERTDVAETLAAKRAIGVFLGPARRARGHACPAVPLAPAPRTTPSDILT